jgi:hypothetical protein
MNQFSGILKAAGLSSAPGTSERKGGAFEQMGEIFDS